MFDRLVFSKHFSSNYSLSMIRFNPVAYCITRPNVLQNVTCFLYWSNDTLTHTICIPSSNNKVDFNLRFCFLKFENNNIEVLMLIIEFVFSSAYSFWRIIDKLE